MKVNSKMLRDVVKFKGSVYALINSRSKTKPLSNPFMVSDLRPNATAWVLLPTPSSVKRKALKGDHDNAQIQFTLTQFASDKETKNTICLLSGWFRNVHLRVNQVKRNKKSLQNIICM